MMTFNKKVSTNEMDTNSQNWVKSLISPLQEYGLKLHGVWLLSWYFVFCSL